MKGTVVTLGEIMLRLKSPGFSRLFQEPSLEASFGGGEANVALSLSILGQPSRFATALPDNPLGHGARDLLRSKGVDTSAIAWGGERLGLYFLEAGANQRPSTVVYDRAGSSMATAGPDTFDWEQVFADACWFHITGITPALSESAADLSLRALDEAQKRAIPCSIDLNFRKKLWNYGKTAPQVMGTLVERCQVVVANEEDCQKSLGIEAPEVDVVAGHVEQEQIAAMATLLLERYPNVERVAITMRESISASHNNWSAALITKGDQHFSSHYPIKNIVDRVGAGDSFGAGLIFGLLHKGNDRDALEFATAASCLKHSIPGDVNSSTLAEVETLLAGDGSGRVQR